MEITHNEINRAISEMDAIVSKGQPFAKRNKERQIRAVLREMRNTQTKPPVFKEVKFYTKMWLINQVKTIWKRLAGRPKTKAALLPGPLERRQYV